MKITFLGAVVLFAAQNLLAALRIAEIHMLDARHGWAWSSGLAEHRHLLRTTDGAKTWTDVTPGAYPYAEEGSCFRDAQTAWVPIWDHHNPSGGLLHTTNGGKSWTLLNDTNSPVYTEKSYCRFLSATYGVAQTSDGAAGSSYYNYFETHDGGKTWQPIPLHPRNPDLSPSEPFTFHLSNICEDRMAFNPPGTLVIAYGDMGDETPKQAVRLSVSNDSGKNWRDLKLPLPAEFHEALSTPDEPVFFDTRYAILDSRLFKENADNSHAYDVLAFYVTRDGGKNWVMRPAVLHLDSASWPESKVNIFAKDNIFVLAGDKFYVSHDGARSWQTIRPNIDIGERAKREVLQLDFVDQQHGWMIISEDIASHPDGDYILYKTSDGGKTWAEVPLRLVK